MTARPPAADARALAHVIRGAAVALLGSLVGGGLGFALSVTMGRLLAPEEFGLFVLALQFLIAGAWIGIAGADFAAIRYVAAATTAGAKRGAMVTPLALAAVLSTAIAVAAAVLADPIAHDLVGQPRFADVLRVLAIALPLTVTAQMLSAAHSGLEHARGELTRKAVEQGGRLGLGVVAVAAGWGVAGIAGAMAAAALAAVLAVALLLAPSLPRGETLELLPVREVVGFAWPQTVAGVARRSFDLILVAVLARYGSAREVALLGAALAIGLLPQMVYNSFAFRFSPTISRLYAAGDLPRLEEMLHAVTRWVSVASVPFYAVAIALPGPLLELYGDEYRAAAPALALVALASLANSLAGPVEWALIMSGRVKLEMAANVTVTIVTAGLAFVLVPRYAASGAAVCVVVHYLGANALKMLFVHRTLGMHTLSVGLLRPLAAAAAASAVALAVAGLTGLGDSLAGAAALASLLVAAYGALTAAGVGISADDRRALRAALRGAA